MKNLSELFQFLSKTMQVLRDQVNYIQCGGFRVMGGGLADWLACHSVGLFHSIYIFASGWVDF